MYKSSKYEVKIEDIQNNFDAMMESFALFQKSRKKSGKDYAWVLLEYLFDQQKNQIFIDDTHLDEDYQDDICVDHGWTQSSQIERDLVDTGKIPHKTTLFRLLNELHEFRILQKGEIVEEYPRSKLKKQKVSVYYRVVINSNQAVTSKNRDDLIEGFNVLYQSYVEANKMLVVAFILLNENGIPDTMVTTRLKEMREKKDRRLDEIGKILEDKIISNMEFWKKTD